MLLKKQMISRVFWYFIIYQFTKVFGQVCVETKMGYRDVPETYLYTYMEAYEKSNCLFWCTDTRVATAVGTRTVQKMIQEQTNVCCEGYIKDPNYNGNSIHCKPHCPQPCINGYCKSPGVCFCDPGYVPDVFDTNICSPICIKGCEHGTCTAPNICLCDSGYELTNGLCEPICADPCHNGSCVAPDTCQCHPGYKKSENDTCEPYCSSYSASGECISTLICEPGWTKVTKGLIELCEPVCSDLCVHGFCVAPDTCECSFGYEESANEICEPHCSSGCSHGICVSPEICVCDPGWYKKEMYGDCQAHCDHCGNGTCVAPNICECFPGYKAEEFDERETAACVPVCDNCDGTCIAPGKCVCELPQETMLVNADGGPCDCIDNCSDTASKCERTMCAITTTIASDTEHDTEFVEEVTAANIVSSTDDVRYDDGSVTDDYRNVIQEKIEKASWFNSSWIYAAVAILILAVIIVMASTIIKRKYLNASNRKIFNTYAILERYNTIRNYSNEQH